MAQKYKVFINDKAVFFHSNKVNANNFPSHCVLISNKENEIKTFIAKNELADTEIHIFGTHAFENYFKNYIKIDAAGGLVENSKNEYLFILRHDKWDLPKGKVEEGEALDETAIREVEEECGMTGLKLKEHLITTYHTYEMFGKLYLKSTPWYKMTSDFDGELTPQLEESITKVEWKHKEKLNEVKTNTYGSILDVLSTISSPH